MRTGGTWRDTAVVVALIAVPWNAMKTELVVTVGCNCRTVYTSASIRRCFSVAGSRSNALLSAATSACYNQDRVSNES